MTQTFDNREGVLHSIARETALYRMAEFASAFGSEHIATAARTTADRVSAGLFYVACVGQFKRGKSTLVNALIRETVLPTGVVPVTTVPSIIRYGTALAARVRFEGTAWTDIPVNAVEDFVSEEKNPANVKRVVGLEIFVPSSLLKTGMCLVDTPGLGSVFAESTAATHAFVPHVDAAIIVIGADPPLSGEELQLVETVARQVDDLLFVLNKADRTTAVERKAATEFASNILTKRLRSVPVVLEVSALERLERRGPTRDWPSLVRALETLVLNSGRSLVREATERGLRRTSHQLLALIKEERETLLRSLEDSEQRISELRKALEEAEGAIRDLGVLLTAEQQRLSEGFASRREHFLKHAEADAQRALTARLHSLTGGRNGPEYRRRVNRLAQDFARVQLTPWLDGEARYAEEEFRKTARRFVELANDFLHHLTESGIPGLEELPGEIGSEQGLRARSQFHFHLIERVAAPASPLLFISDLVLGVLSLHQGIIRDAQEFIEQLLEINSSRVQSDVEERVRESRRKLETEIKAVLGEASAIADRALARARAVQASGATAVEAALAHLNAVEVEVRRFV